MVASVNDVLIALLRFQALEFKAQGYNWDLKTFESATPNQWVGVTAACRKGL